MSEIEQLAAEWMQYAVEDLAVAEGQYADDTVPGRYTCYLSQQAAEKAMKALLVRVQIEFAFTHDLQKLARLIDPPLDAVAAHELADLSRWATETRYPSESPAADRDDARVALAAARAIVAECRARFDGEG